jgi:hypothetical protein
MPVTQSSRKVKMEKIDFFPREHWLAVHQQHSKNVGVHTIQAPLQLARIVEERDKYNIKKQKTNRTMP